MQAGDWQASQRHRRHPWHARGKRSRGEARWIEGSERGHRMPETAANIGKWRVENQGRCRAPLPAATLSSLRAIMHVEPLARFGR